MTLFGPNSDTEEEWEYSPTEMKRLIEQKKLYDKIQREKEKVSENEKDSDGIMWGMGLLISSFPKSRGLSNFLVHFDLYFIHS